MLKCPACHQRTRGEDLISGICSHCGAKLAGTRDSAHVGSSDQLSDTIDPQSVGVEPSGGNSSPGQTERTLIVDDSIDGPALTPPFQLPDVTVDFSGPVVPLATQGSPTQDFDSTGQEPGKNFPSSDDPSSITFISDDFGSATDLVQEEFPMTIEAAGEQTLPHVDSMDPSNLRTFVGDTGAPPIEEHAVERTLVVDSPDAVQRTVNSVWGGAEGAAGHPEMTLKAKEAERPAKDSKPTLVIKTRELIESGGVSIGDGPEYELFEVLGKGGMGVVYDARQTSIDRHVALKMIKGDAAASEKQKAKFLAEVVVTGDLDHPNIVPVYDVGTNARGNLFYSMKKVQGTPWNKVIATRSLAENLDILMRTADAIGFAHARGVVHRDLKPENIMLGEFGEVLVMDWGLAHPIAGFRKSKSLTISPSMGGTPAYMAPEMATGPIEKISAASDIYLLGAILYEILTGRPPHAQKDLMKCLMAAARNEINPTQKTGELVEISRKAMSTNPRDRYSDVKAFQAAIREYQSHTESITLSTRAEDDLRSAKQSNDYQHFAKALFGFQEAHELWSGNKRAAEGLSQAKLDYAESARHRGDFDLGLSLLDPANPAHLPLREQLIEARTERIARQKRLVALKRAAIGLVATLLVIVSGAAIWIRAEQKKAVTEAERASNAKQIALFEKSRAESAAEEEKKARIAATESRKEAIRQREVAVEERQKAEAARAEEERARLAAVEATRQEAAAKEAAQAAEHVAVAEREKAETAKRREEYESYISKIGLAASQIDKNAFDAAREVLKTCKPELRNWEWGRLMHLCTQSERSFETSAPLEALAIDQTGKRFATGGWNGLAQVWDLETGAVLSTFQHGGDYVNAVAFSPDGKTLATGSNDPSGYLEIWEIATGQRQRIIHGHTDEILSLSYTKDGTKLLTSSYDKTARLWDVATGQEIKSFIGHNWWVWSASFSPDESQIVTAGHDGLVMVWDVASGQSVSAFDGHQGPVFTARFSPSGQEVVSAGYDRRILFWSPAEVERIDLKQIVEGGASQTALIREFVGHTNAVQSVAFSADGQTLISASQDNTIRVWDIVSGAPVKTFRGHGGGVQSIAVLADGRRILSAAHDRTVREWSADGQQEIRTIQGRVLDGHADSVLAAVYSPDQRLIVTASRDRSARVWDALSGHSTLTLEEGHAYLASSAIFFDDGKRLLTAAVDNTARIWDVATGGQILRLDRTGRSAAATVTRDGRFIATGSSDRTVQVWESAAGQRQRVLVGHPSEVSAVAFTADGQLLASGDTNGHVRLWNMPSGDLHLKLEGHSRRIAAISFMEDGRRLLTASGDNTVGVWDVATGQELPGVLKHPDAVLAMQLVPGQDQVITSCADHRVRRWNLSTATVDLTLGPFEGDVTSLSLSDDGQRILLANSDERTVRQWDMISGKELLAPQPGGGLGPVVDLKRQGGLLWAVAFVPGSGDLLTVGGSDARLWDLKSGQEKMSFSPHGAVASASFSPDGSRVVTGSWDNSAKVWDARTGRVLRKLDGAHTSFVNTAMFSPDGIKILTASDDGTAKIWNVDQGAVLHTLQGHTDRVRSARYSPNGHWIVTTSNDSSARLWDAESGQPVREFRGHRFAVLCSSISTDGQFLVTGGEDNSARIWEVKTGREIRVLSGHTASITSVAFSPDGSRIVTGSQDQSAKLWDTHTGNEILTLSRHTEDVTSVSFSPDGMEVLTGSRDGTAIIWLSRDWHDTTAVTSATSTLSGTSTFTK